MFFGKIRTLKTDFSITQKYKQRFLLLKSSRETVKLTIYCEITGCRTCYFVSPKFCIGQP